MLYLYETCSCGASVTASGLADDSVGGVVVGFRQRHAECRPGNVQLAELSEIEPDWSEDDDRPDRNR